MPEIDIVPSNEACGAHAINGEGFSAELQQLLNHNPLFLALTWEEWLAISVWLVSLVSGTSGLDDNQRAVSCHSFLKSYF